jgi:hypothetical protein
VAKAPTPELAPGGLCRLQIAVLLLTHRPLQLAAPMPEAARMCAVADTARHLPSSSDVGEHERLAR